MYTLPCGSVCGYMGIGNKLFNLIEGGLIGFNQYVLLTLH